MDETKRKRMMERLRKCMALSGSAEPHEAAAALRHAQALMRELGLTEDDLAGIEMGEAVVKTREGFGQCWTLAALKNIICAAFAVSACTERNPGSANRANVRYIGRASNVLLAEYAHRVVWRAMSSAWDAVLRDRPWLKGEPGKRQAFHAGWLEAVKSKVEAIALTDDEARAIRRREELVYGKGGITTNTTKGGSLDGGLYGDGAEAGSAFDLYRPVGKSPLGLTHQRTKA